jgi:hypothetical protein
MPPEALRRRHFSEKSDVWAFAVTACPSRIEAPTTTLTILETTATTTFMDFTTYQPMS